jgi:hypothetical protein
VAPVVTLGPNHAVHVAYYDLGTDARDYESLEGPVWEGTWQVVVANSFDGGAHFDPGVVAEPEVVPYERVLVIFTMPPVALAAGGDRLCMAWGDSRNGDADVLARCSRDQGRTWQPTRRVNDDPVANGLWQYLPRLGIAPNGRIDAVFYDRRDDGQNLNNDVSYAFSNDGGRTFSPRLKLTTTGSSSTLIGQQYAIPAAGDAHDFGFRIALLSENDHLFAAWADTSHSAPGTMSQDIVATTVTPPGSGRSLFVLGAVVVALMAALGGAIALVRRGRKPGDPSPVADQDAPATVDA